MRHQSKNNFLDGVKTIFEILHLAWKAHPFYALSLLGLEVTIGLVPLGTAWFSKLLFDLLPQIFQTGLTASSGQQLAFIVIAQATLTIFSQTGRQLSQFLNAELERHLVLSIQTTIYGKINSLQGLASFEKPEFYDLIQLAEQSAQMVPMQALSNIVSMIQGLMPLASFAIALLIFNPLLAGLVLVAAIPQALLQFSMGYKRFQILMGNTPKERRTSYYGHILSNIRFIKELRLFNLGDYFLESLRNTRKEIHQSQRDQQIKELRWQIALTAFSSFISSVAFIIVIAQTISQRLTLGDVTFYISAITSVQSGMTSLIYSISTLNDLRLFFSRFTDLMTLPPSLDVKPNAQLAPTLSSGIEFRNVSFRYNDNMPWVLHDLNLHIPAQECTALVGLNGEGKTTLVKLLMRFYDPSEGQILWDGIDLRELDLLSLRARLGAVFQDFTHYDLSVQENIGAGNIAERNNLPKIQDAAERAGVHQVIENLPRGYQSVLSLWLAEPGESADLSGGEWQKIALARMFMRPADFLVLDEPTSALDADAEYEIYQRLVQLTEGTTSLLISHRLSAVRMAQHIAVLENGQISEYGPHQMLISQGGTYARLYNMQAEKYHSTSPN
jgi:ATP-binding cassette subfamily B protein